MNETTDATAILAPLWKRKWLILAVAVLVAGATYGYYKRQPALYSASTQLDLSSGSEARQLLSGTQGKTQLSSHTLADAAALITSNGVGRSRPRAPAEQNTSARRALARCTRRRPRKATSS